jgi:hypothetical protein
LRKTECHASGPETETATATTETWEQNISSSLLHGLYSLCSSGTFFAFSQFGVQFIQTLETMSEYTF